MDILVICYSNCFLYMASNVLPSLSFHIVQPFADLPKQKSAAVLGLVNILSNIIANKSHLPHINFLCFSVEGNSHKSLYITPIYRHFIFDKSFHVFPIRISSICTRQTYYFFFNLRSRTHI